MKAEHHYELDITWTGNQGKGTANYRAYARAFSISIDQKADIDGSSDHAFRGDKTKHNPEELLVASLSSCHLLWYLHLCAETGVIVTSYCDHATGIMVETPDGGGYFKEVILNPVVTVADRAMITEARALHKKANELCFIANSVNFPVKHYPTITVQ